MLVDGVPHTLDLSNWSHTFCRANSQGGKPILFKALYTYMDYGNSCGISVIH